MSICVRVYFWYLNHEAQFDFRQSYCSMNYIDGVRYREQRYLVVWQFLQLFMQSRWVFYGYL